MSNLGICNLDCNLGSWQSEIYRGNLESIGNLKSRETIENLLRI